jgi:choline-sulfatase
MQRAASFPRSGHLRWNIIAIGALSLLAPSCSSTLAAEPQTADRHPNILYIMSDQQRFDALGCVRPGVHTPALDRLAKEGVRFDSTYVAQALCTPSRASIFSGLYPHAHKLDKNVYDQPNALADAKYNLRVVWPDLLRRAGYFTGYIGKWHLGEDNPGCFNEWYGYNSLKPHWLGKKQESQYRSDYETDQAIDFLDRNQEKRFALCVSYYPPHTPYDPPDKYAALYENTAFAPAKYWGGVTAIDHCVGRLLEKLDGLGLRDNTLVLFTADHGDHFGNRPGGSHKGVAYDEAARVPLILRYPGVFDGGKVRTELVSNVDIMPTLLQVAGLAIPASLQGASLVPLAAGHAPQWRKLVCTENREDGGGHSRGIRTERYKLILRERETKGASSLHELYDLARDPQEHVNLFGKQQTDVIRTLLDQFSAWAICSGDALGLELAEKCRKDLASN